LYFGTSFFLIKIKKPVFLQKLDLGQLFCFPENKKIRFFIQKLMHINLQADSLVFTKKLASSNKINAATQYCITERLMSSNNFDFEQQN